MAQLPIGDYIKLGTREVLTVNQVYEILLTYLDCKDWRQAFMSAIPTRKLRDSTILDDPSDTEESIKDESTKEDKIWMELIYLSVLLANRIAKYFQYKIKVLSIIKLYRQSHKLSWFRLVKSHSSNNLLKYE